jgi:DNA-binding HxlR family transcriptional regulator
MITHAQFCPVAKAAEVFGDRWTPIIIRELCFGARSFGALLAAAPPISRTVLAQRLKQLEQSGVVHIEPKPSGKGHLYRLTPAGEDFRSIIELLSAWGQRWGQGLLRPDDLDPQALVWSMRRQIDPAGVPAQGLVIRFEFRGLPKFNRSPRYGGWCCGLMISRCALKRPPPEILTSSSPPSSKLSRRCGLAMLAWIPHLRAERSL